MGENSHPALTVDGQFAYDFSYLEVALTVMSQEIMKSASCPAEIRVKDRLIAEFELPEHEAAAFASIAFARCLHAFAK
ncbi:hypothetical protein QCN27_14045 [Cereibacter sp. SYSU M97828]|nr:hypothetical protein [Cereibacter flavus]